TGINCPNEKVTPMKRILMSLLLVVAVTVSGYAQVELTRVWSDLTFRGGNTNIAQSVALNRNRPLWVKFSVPSVVGRMSSCAAITPRREISHGKIPSTMRFKSLSMLKEPMLSQQLLARISSSAAMTSGMGRFNGRRQFIYRSRRRLRYAAIG